MRFPSGRGSPRGQESRYASPVWRTRTIAKGQRDAKTQPPAGRHRGGRPGPGLSRPLCHVPDGQGRRNGHQGRAARRRTGPATRGRQQGFGCSLRAAQRTQEVHHARPEDRARQDRAAQARRQGGRAAGELRPRSDGPSRSGMVGPARAQSAAGVRVRLRVRPVRPGQQPAGDGRHRAGVVGDDECHRFSRRAAREGRSGSRGFPQRHPSVRGGHDRAVRTALHGHGAAGRSGDAGDGLSDARIESDLLLRPRRSAAAHRQSARRTIGRALQRVCRQGRFRCDHRRKGFALVRTARCHGQDRPRQ